MDKFVTGLAGKPKADDESMLNFATTKTKTRKYDEARLVLGFTSTRVGNEERPQRAVCLKILASDNMKPKKLNVTWRLDIPHTKRSL